METCRIEPLFSKIVVTRSESKEKTDSGIYLPDTAKEKPAEGIVQAVGAGRVLDDGERVPCTVAVGDHVLFRKHAGDDISVDGNDYTVLEEEQILCVVKPKVS